MLIINKEAYENASADGRGPKLPSGNYVVRVTNAYESQTKGGKQTLVVVWDVCDGQYADVFSRGNVQDYQHDIEITMDDNCMWKLKRLLTSIEKSNNSTFSADAWVNNPNPAMLNGLFLGIGWAVTEFREPYQEVIDTYPSRDVIDGLCKQPVDYVKPERPRVNYNNGSASQGGYANAQPQMSGGYYAAPTAGQSYGR